MNRINILIANIRNWLNTKREKSFARKIVAIQREADRHFNIVTRDNHDYILYDDVIISTEDDGDLLTKLKSLRRLYIQSNISEL